MDESKFSSTNNGQQATEKSWLDRLAQAFSGEPQDQAELVDILRDAQQRNLFDDYALQMIEGVFHVSEQQVRDVMIPRSQMVVVDHESDLKAMIEVIAPSGHSRFPVVGDNRDEILGILLAKDILAYVLEENEKFDIRDIIRPPVFIPDSKRLNVLLKEFRLSRNHMAIVADEYGGIAGLITIEDVIEQIIDDIDDFLTLVDDKFAAGDDKALEELLQHLMQAFPGADIPDINLLSQSTVSHHDFVEINSFIKSMSPSSK